MKEPRMVLIHITYQIAGFGPISMSVQATRKGKRKVITHVSTTYIGQFTRLGTRKVKGCCLQLGSHKQVEISINMETEYEY